MVGIRILAAFSLTISASAFAQDRILVLSGGANPANNHYSQYLQTRTLADGMRARRGDQVSVLFAAGNNEVDGQRAADVHRVRTEGENSITEMLFGKINGNQPATKRQVETYFGNLDGLAPQDTFYLFVSDHGMPNPRRRGSYDDNCINLWEYDANRGEASETDASCLSRTELQKFLGNLPAKRKVFVMSQCYSGGFHRMSVSDDGKYPSADTNVCGFTAVTEDTTASGCTPDADGPGYRGYERFFTQQVTGNDVVSGQPMPYAAKSSLSEAHEAAALEDATKDIPISTSDYYLMQWAKHLGAKEFVSRTSVSARTGLAAYASIAKKGLPAAPVAGLPAEVQQWAQAKRAYLEKTIALLRSSDAEMKVVYADASQGTLVAALNAAKQDRSQNSFRLRLAEAGMKRADMLLTQRWSMAVRQGTISGLSADVRQKFEPAIAELGSERLLLLLSMLQTKNPTAGSALSKYYSTRANQMLEWANASNDQNLNDAYETIVDGKKAVAPLVERDELLERRYDNLRRVLFVRQELAAVQALGALKDEQALQELKGLLACESATL